MKITDRFKVVVTDDAQPSEDMSVLTVSIQIPRTLTDLADDLADLGIVTSLRERLATGGGSALAGFFAEARQRLRKIIAPQGGKITGPKAAQVEAALAGIVAPPDCLTLTAEESDSHHVFTGSVTLPKASTKWPDRFVHSGGMTALPKRLKDELTASVLAYLKQGTDAFEAACRPTAAPAAEPPVKPTRKPEPRVAAVASGPAVGLAEPAVVISADPVDKADADADAGPDAVGVSDSEAADSVVVGFPAADSVVVSDSVLGAAVPGLVPGSVSASRDSRFGGSGGGGRFSSSSVRASGS